MLRTLSTFLTILALSTLVNGCGAGSERPKRIVLITLDTLRLDAMPPDRPSWTAMPLTRAWANDARLFLRHYSATSTTQRTAPVAASSDTRWASSVPT